MTTNLDLPAEAQWVNKQPSNINYLRPNSFRFNIQILPNVTYFCQSANIPEMSLGAAIQPTSLVDIPLPGEKISFGSLSVKFMIQEDLANYIELYNWLVGLGFPQNNSQFAEWVAKNQYRFPSLKKSSGPQLSDATLLVLDSNNTPVSKFTFYDCFPVLLSGLDFDVSSGRTEFFQGVAEFRYRSFVPESLL